MLNLKTAILRNPHNNERKSKVSIQTHKALKQYYGLIAA